MIRLQEYIREDGSCPYRKWFYRLNAVAAAKVATVQVRISLGNTSSIKWFEGIGEIRIDWGPGYRVYLAKDGDTLMILFGGGIKAKQKADIAKAKRLHVECKARKRIASRRP
ncbi:MAG: type II toxin-antitoxin system RelE/ParE family toxin [Rhodanobacteraceae bacterium]